MANTPANLEATRSSMPQYVELLDASFDDGVSFDNKAKAVWDFRATLIAGAVRR